MKLKRGLSRIWALLYRVRLARAPMPFWRVVVEARLNRALRKWPRAHVAAITAVFVWARTVEEAEGLAALALEREGLDVITADAVRCKPAAPPRRAAAAMARTQLRFLSRCGGQAGADGASRSGARA